MSKLYKQFRKALYDVVDLYGVVSIGAAGAPTIATGAFPGVASISRTSAGLYVLTYQDNYTLLLNLKVMLAAAAAENLAFQIISNSLTAKTITFLCTAEGVAADPSNGSSLYIGVAVRLATK